MKHFLLLLSLCISTILAEAQSTCGLEKLSMEKIISNSEYIVEGKVIKSVSFRREENIFTKNTIKVFKQFKGGDLTQEIQVITWGGEIEGEYQEYNNLLRLKEEQTGVFCLIPSKIVAGNFDTYGNVQGFWGYFSQNGILQARNPFYTFKNIGTELFKRIEKETGKAFAFIQKSDYEIAYERKLGSLQLLYGCDGVGIEYGFRNLNVQPGANANLAFDVWARTIWGNFQLADGNVILEFNPAVFGTNVVANGKVVAAKGSAILSPDYTLSLSDLATNRFQLQASATFPPTNIFILDTTGADVFHIELDITNIFQNPDITFDETAMTGLSQYYDSLVNGYLPFECLLAQDSLSDMEGIALTNIFDFYPDTIAAGTGQILTIVGTDFGADRIGTFSGYVAFTDDTRADNTGTIFNTLIFPLDTDYLLWSDTLIMVRVPSNVNSDSFRTAGSGPITVKKKGAFSTPKVSTDILTIPYAVWNRIYPNNLPTDTSFTARLYGHNNLGGYDIFYQTAFRNLVATTGDEEAFTRALVKWRCSTYVNWKRVDVSPPFGSPQSCFVSASNLGAGTVTTLAQTGHTISNCSGSGSPIPISKGFAITFNNTITWHTDTSTAVPAGSQDLESVALHELGHAILLYHNNQITDVMYFTSPTITRRDIKYHDKQGGEYVVGISVLPVPPSYAACLNPMTALNDSICGNVYLKDEKGMIFEDIKLFPNPTANTAKLQLNVIHSEEISIKVYNNLGVEINCMSAINYRGEKGEYLIDLNNYAAGLYRIQIRLKNKIYTTTLSKY